MELDSLDIEVTGDSPDDRSLIPDQDKDYSLRHHVWTYFKTRSLSYTVGTKPSSLGEQRSQNGANPRMGQSLPPPYLDVLIASISGM